MNKLRPIVLTSVVLLCSLSIARADVYINVMAVNPTKDSKETNVKYSLPGDLTSGDILDTNGLELDYNVNDSNYFVHGKVKLEPKESKTFRIRVKDVWKLTQQEIDNLKKKIDQGYEEIGKLKDVQVANQLKENLVKKLDFIVQEEGSKADTVEKRIDSYRAYSKELKRIEQSALAVDYWRSDPNEVKKDKIIRFNILADNPTDAPKTYKHKHYLPYEIRPEDLVEFEGFEVRYDQEKKQVFLYKEDELKAKEKKAYTIGIRDIWFIPKKDTDYLKSRADYAYDFLKNSKFSSMAKSLFDKLGELLKIIEDSQSQKKDNILDYISNYRDNQKNFSDARYNVESLEKLLAILREDLEKSKVKNVLQKIGSLKGVGDVSKAIFDKTKPNEGTAWNFIAWILGFVGVITLINFVVWFLRSNKDKSVSDKEKTDSNQ